MRTSIHRGASKAMITGTSAPAPPLRPAMAPHAARPAPRHDISRVSIADVAQRKAAPGINGGAYLAPNRTGLPDRLRAGVEALSGVSMDKVQIHFGSSEPARLNAHAFTRGADIHLAPGQERHLPHEAWHVVQQAQARVQPTMEVAGNDVNDDAGLEREADTLGAASAAHGSSLFSGGAPDGVAARAAAPARLAAADACVQRVIKIKSGSLKGDYSKPGAAATKEMISDVEKKIGDELGRGWKSWIGTRAKSKKTHSYTTDSFLEKLKEKFPKKDTSSKVRPNFLSSAYSLGTITREIQTGEDQSDLKPSEENLALPHRSSFKLIKDSTEMFIERKEDADDLYRWSDRLIDATEERRELNAPKIKSKKKREKYKGDIEKQLDGAKKARKNLKVEVESGSKLELTSSVAQDFLKYTNSLHGNIPDYGPHVGVNINVSDRAHLNIGEDGTISPGSRAALSMSPHRGKGVALTSDGNYIVTTSGHKVDPEELSKRLQKEIEARGTDKTTIDEGDLMRFDEDT